MKDNEKSHDLLGFRLADMLRRLNQGEHLSVAKLAKDYGVNSRTIQRDLNERFAYLPLKREDGRYFLEPFYLGKLNEQNIRSPNHALGMEAVLHKNRRYQKPGSQVQRRTQQYNLEMTLSHASSGSPGVSCISGWRGINYE